MLTYTFADSRTAALIALTAADWGFESFSPMGYFQFTLTFVALQS